VVKVAEKENVAPVSGKLNIVPKSTGLSFDSNLLNASFPSISHNDNQV